MIVPKLIIHCITYNHERFVVQALEGFVMQKTNFLFEVWIADDCSADGTAKIIAKYAKKHPDIIKFVTRRNNLGVSKNFIDLASKIKSQYVAICEGDDYWTDPNKLQKQVDFLDSHPDYSVCFHPVQIVCENGTQPTSTFPLPEYRFNKTTLGLEDLLKHNFIQTNSVMYRWRFVDESIANIFPQNILPVDWFLHLLHAEQGLIGFIPDIMAVYRKHAGGIWAGDSQSDDFFIRNGVAHILFWEALQARYKKDTRKNALFFAEKTIAAFMRHKLFQEIKSFSESFSELYRQVTDEIGIKTNESDKKIRKYRRYLKCFICLLAIETLVLVVCLF